MVKKISPFAAVLSTMDVCLSCFLRQCELSFTGKAGILHESALQNHGLDMFGRLCQKGMS